MDRGSTWYLEPPIADASRLAENCAVWTEEAELTTVWQTPVPDLKKKSSKFHPFTGTLVDGG
ncbi:hypothetical protein K0M31_019366 [Melipona bicolor]|uniref:Uncharacterized protein n=1 Tax=Melipona bicolor TaxID=60889 RepID=A0AA40G291_9HYME|nr:hypothetical protein K0M31_019366 [Melipona bicolor]